jgi:hypothetical protein
MVDTRAANAAVLKIAKAAKASTIGGDGGSVQAGAPEERQTGYCVELSVAEPLELSRFARKVPGARVFVRGDITPATLDVYFEPATLAKEPGADGQPRGRVPPWLVAASWAAFLLLKCRNLM